MAVANSDDDAGYWPGYVAAVACLVQSLLLLSVVMAVTLYQLGMLAGRSRLEQDTTPQPNPAALGIALVFPSATWRIDKAARERLRAEVEKQRREGVTHWRISLRTQTDNAMKRRGGYLRLMIVRNELIALGVLGNRIEVRLYDIPDDDQSGGQTVRIEPMMDDGAERGMP